MLPTFGQPPCLAAQSRRPSSERCHRTLLIPAPFATSPHVVADWRRQPHVCTHPHRAGGRHGAPRRGGGRQHEQHARAPAASLLRPLHCRLLAPSTASTVTQLIEPWTQRERSRAGVWRVEPTHRSVPATGAAAYTHDALHCCFDSKRFTLLLTLGTLCITAHIDSTRCIAAHVWLLSSSTLGMAALTAKAVHCCAHGAHAVRARCRALVLLRPPT